MIRLYHGTTDILVPTIRANGLVPLGAEDYGHQPMLSTSLHDASDFAYERFDRLRKIGITSEPVVLVYDLPRGANLVTRVQRWPTEDWYALKAPVPGRYIKNMLVVPHTTEERFKGLPIEKFATASLRRHPLRTAKVAVRRHLRHPPGMCLCHRSKKIDRLRRKMVRRLK